ncbi:MAG: sulfurtransferase TusA family protein [Deltaproteobacteria bacterium TMED126]|nr:sulfurtransferase TusA family protein [Candidatus Dadabacteria bacterium]NSW97769.1 sulfurtransferase TusA family protein [Deltaproteobacteria bacterium TMED126]|tara:strand:- start:33860 stop:34042 length:183 start_codon:yes stop_codon:yes gene_type:complete
MTFVKTKLRLKEMAKGEVLEVKLSDGEPLESVPENIIQDGHQVLKIISNGKDSRIFIKKN